MSKKDGSYKEINGAGIQKYAMATGMTLFIVGLMISEMTSHFAGLILILVGFLAFDAAVIWLCYSVNRQIRRGESLDSENEKQLALRNLLKDYGIDYQNDEEMDRMIEMMKNQGNKADFLKDMFEPLKTVLTYILLPVIAYLMSMVANNNDFGDIFRGCLIMTISVAFLALELWALYLVFDHMFNKDKHFYEEIVSDLNNIKVFKNKDLGEG